MAAGFLVAADTVWGLWRGLNGCYKKLQSIIFAQMLPNYHTPQLLPDPQTLQAVTAVFVGSSWAWSCPCLELAIRFTWVDRPAAVLATAKAPVV